MTYHAGLPTVAPEVGHAYHLRAGLLAIVTDELDFGGVPHFKGYVLNPTQTCESGAIIIWYTSGAYSPVRNVQHELDIIWEME